MPKDCWIFTEKERNVMRSMKTEKPNIVRISDGLGNQLFQYAFGYSLYKKTGKELIIDPMYSGKLRCYQLESFRIDFSKRFVGEKADYVLGCGARNSAPLRLKYREQKIKYGKYEIIKEDFPMKYDENVYQNSSAYYIGFWQSHQYFDEYYDDIKRQIQLRNKKFSLRGKKYLDTIQTNIPGEEPSVSLHIRRTDYNRTKNNVCLSDQFYRQALEGMQDNLGKFSLYIFTDDKNFVKENFHFHKYTLVEGVDDLEEFVLMQKCRHHIIANSTFSWWGAYLAENKGGIVYAPLSDIWTEQFYLPQWNKINTQVGHPDW